jgi:hypothetical protein
VVAFEAELLLGVLGADVVVFGAGVGFGLPAACARVSASSASARAASAASMAAWASARAARIAAVAAFAVGKESPSVTSGTRPSGFTTTTTHRRNSTRSGRPSRTGRSRHE